VSCTSDPNTKCDANPFSIFADEHVDGQTGNFTLFMQGTRKINVPIHNITLRNLTLLLY